MKNLKSIEVTVKPIFAWYDMWVGLFWDRNKKWLYIFPIPMFGLVLKFKTEYYE